MKKFVLATFSSMCLLTVSLHAHDNDMSGNSSQMMNMKMSMTENDLYSHLNNQDKAMYDKLDAQQRAFVLRIVNAEMQMMQQKMMNGQGQMQQDQGMYNQR
ncbi:MAG: hypothetical protein H0W88_11300 [Parachlamydiaceae bacterium]|nr:hypothetical protein [Parachlamydiaceae bacterium]